MPFTIPQALKQQAKVLQHLVKFTTWANSEARLTVCLRYGGLLLGDSAVCSEREVPEAPL